MDKYDVLRKYFGYSSFRKGQEEMVDCLLSGRDALGIMPTGAGKSICYQVPAIMFGGVTIVVSPLISLMKDQVNALVQQGVKAAYINRSLTDTQYDKVLKNAALGSYKIIYVAPERLDSVGFVNLCRRIEISMVAVDESHCVSQWGQDFRPSYLNINKFISLLPKRPIIGAFTATATYEVKNDIIDILQLNNPTVVTTGFDRPNLFFSVLRPAKKDDKLVELLRERKGKSGIVYCSTRKKVESVCDFLIEKGFSTTRYHAGLSDEERIKNQDDFVYDRKPIMVATNAFGMGIDKSNVSYVIHYNMPKNIESYYQEAGRAGRDGQEADCILLYGAADVQTCRYFIENTEPNPQLTPEQNEMFKHREEERLKHMIFYCRTSDCLRNYMLRYFGDEAEDNCGKCSNCLTKFETVDVTVEAQKILSCIIRTGQKFGAAIISDVLRGKTNDRIISFGLNKQSTFGIMKDAKPTEIKYIIEKLEEQGYIISVGAGKPILRVTEMSYPVLKGKAKVNVKKTIRIKSKVKTVEETVDIPLFNILKQIRYEIASKKGVPAFLIFSDASLTDMCRKLPVTPEEFLAVNGVGDNKLKQYGDRFISAIAEYKAENIDSTDNAGGKT
ncbi:MAG: DNA helicase RecQ [Ruminococcus sp.]